MEWLDQIWAQLAVYVDITYMVSFMLLSYLVKRYFQDFLFKITKMKWKTVYTVLIIATLLAVPFILFSFARWEQILFSFTLGTSLHELIFKWIEAKFT